MILKQDGSPLCSAFFTDQTENICDIWIKTWFAYNTSSWNKLKEAFMLRKTPTVEPERCHVIIQLVSDFFTLQSIIIGSIYIYVVQL